MSGRFSHNSRKDGGRRSCDGSKSVLPRYSCLCCILCMCVLLLVGVENYGLMRTAEVMKVETRTDDCTGLCIRDKKRERREFLKSFVSETFMYYAPHSGFNNQVVALKNALKIAKILNRTLVIPPVLDHHAAWLGSCPKKRVLRPHVLRSLVWTRIFELISNSSRRYTSIADIIDLSSITPSKVKTIDLRVFLALWCGVDVKASCGGSLCKAFAEEVLAWGEYEGCEQMLNPIESNGFVYTVENDCTSTIWTYGPHRFDNISVEDKHDLRRRILNEQEWKAEKVNTTMIEFVDVRGSLGPISASVIAFGSMFSTNYKDLQSHIDVRAPSGDKDLDDLIHSLKRLSLASEIIAAGKAYLYETIGHREYFCAQVRLVDGQFKNHQNATFHELRTQLTSYGEHWIAPTPIFVMTDLNWNKDYSLDSGDKYKIHQLQTRNDLIQLASRNVLAAETGFVVGSMKAYRRHQELMVAPVLVDFEIPHVELAIEEVVCSCGTLGFAGTRGSTIADSIRDLRAIDICSTQV